MEEDDDDDLSTHTTYYIQTHSVVWHLAEYCAETPHRVKSSWTMPLEQWRVMNDSHGTWWIMVCVNWVMSVFQEQFVSCLALWLSQLKSYHPAGCVS